MIGDWLPNLAAGWGIQMLGVLSPGPGVALILTMATTEGRAAAVTTCLGIAAGAVCLALAAVVGLAAIFAEFAWGLMAVKLAGATYLTWLAWKAFGRAIEPPPPPRAARSAATQGRTILAGYAMQMTNPKAIMYWLAAAALAGIGAAPIPVILLFIAGAFVISFFGHGAWAVALSSRPFLSLYAAGRRWVEATLGVFFAFTAFKLATSRT